MVFEPPPSRARQAIDVALAARQKQRSGSPNGSATDAPPSLGLPHGGKDGASDLPVSSGPMPVEIVGPLPLPVSVKIEGLTDEAKPSTAPVTDPRVEVARSASLESQRIEIAREASRATSTSSESRTSQSQ